MLKENKNDVTKLKPYYLNIRSIKSKFINSVNSLIAVIEEIQPHVIAIVETNLNRKENLETEGCNMKRDINSMSGGDILAK